MWCAGLGLCFLLRSLLPDGQHSVAIYLTHCHGPSCSCCHCASELAQTSSRLLLVVYLVLVTRKVTNIENIKRLLGWGDGSVPKSISVWSQHLHAGSQQSVIVPGDLLPSSGVCRRQAHMWHAYTHIVKTHILWMLKSKAFPGITDVLGFVGVVLNI